MAEIPILPNSEEPTKDEKKELAKKIYREQKARSLVFYHPYSKVKNRIKWNPIVELKRFEGEIDNVEWFLKIKLT